MRRSDHPSRPSAITCCRFSALKTLAIPAAGVKPTAHVNVSAPGAALAGFQVSINGRFWVSTEALAARLMVVCWMQGTDPASGLFWRGDRQGSDLTLPPGAPIGRGLLAGAKSWI